MLKLYSIRNQSGFGADILNMGATVVNLFAPNREGELLDIALGFEQLSDYLNNLCYFGTTVAPVAGRLQCLGDLSHLVANDGKNHLHSGGECRKIVYEVTQPNKTTLIFWHKFTNSAELELIFQVTEDNEFIIDYTAKSECRTLFNPTNHLYFNLNGAGNSNICNHEFALNSSEILQLSRELIPTGVRLPVINTPYNLQNPVRFSELKQQLPNGLDNYYILDIPETSQPAAVVYSPESGIELQLFTNELGVQVYTADQLDGSLVGKKSHRYQMNDGFCLETQGYPDAPNHAEFPSITLEPNELYRQQTVYKFALSSATV